MCDTCRMVFGSSAKPHNPNSCFLRQTAAVCALCGPDTHFTSCCPKASRKPKAATLPPTPQKHHVKTYHMSGSNEAFVEYLKVNELPIERNHEANRRAVEAHLNAAGITLALPPTPLTKAMIPAELTVCKQLHADNHHCHIKHVVKTTTK